MQGPDAPSRPQHLLKRGLNSDEFWGTQQATSPHRLRGQRTALAPRDRRGYFSPSTDSIMIVLKVAAG
jgi:hypothetical protein